MQKREFYDGDLVPGTHYRVLNLLGAGGMGTVYEVEHTELGKRFVLKALIRDLARRPAVVERLRNEWRALGRLEHPNIVSVTDAGTTSSGVPYYVMELLEGETLSARLRRVRRLPVPQALELCAAVVEGLGAAHAIGIVHRDVKPPNVFLVNGERPKLLDFGVAKIKDVSNVVTGRGVAIGTPRFMSPEQIRGERVDGRADLYACGLLAFEMIAGVGPFDDARDANELLRAHATREAPRLGSLVMGVLPEVDELIAALLAKDVRQRPENAHQVASTLRTLAADYGRRVSSTSLTPFANYSELTPELVLTSPTRDETTRPDGALPPRETATLRVDSVTATSVDPPPRVENLPSTTFAEPVSNQLTEAPPEGASTVLPLRASAVTSRYGTVGPDVFASAGASLDTRTQVPPSTDTPSSLSPVVPGSHSLPRARRPSGWMLALASLVVVATASLAVRALNPAGPAAAARPEIGASPHVPTPREAVPVELDPPTPEASLASASDGALPQGSAPRPTATPPKSRQFSKPSPGRASRDQRLRQAARPPAGLPASGL